MPRGSYQNKNPDSTFPAPKFRTVQDNVKHKLAVMWFDYWEKLPAALKLPPEQMIGKCRVKIYRTWPEVDLLITEPERKDYAWDTLEGAMQTQEPALTSQNYTEWFLTRYHSGGWNCRLYEILPDKEVEIMTCYFEAKDMETYPPRVNLRTVRWEARGNKDYKEFCRLRNIAIPGDAEYQEAQDMTTGAALITELAKQNADLAKENRDIVREQLDELKSPKESGNARGDFAMEGVRAVTEMVIEGAKTAIEVGKSRDLSSAKSYDPLDMIGKTMEIIATAKGDSGGTAMVQLVLDHSKAQTQLISEMHNQTLTYMRERDSRVAPPSAGAGGLDGVLAELPKLEALGRTLGWSRRGGAQEEAPPPQSGGLMKIVEKMVENPSTMQAVASIFAIGFQSIAILMGKTPPAAPAPAAPDPKTAEVAKPEEPRQPTQEERNFMFLEWIEQEFLRCFRDEKLGGTTFAQTFLSMVQTEQGTQFAPGGPPTPVGMQQLGLLRQSGMQSFDRLIRSYSPIWSQVQSYAVQQVDSKEPPKYYKFLHDFFNYNPARATA